MYFQRPRARSRAARTIDSAESSPERIRAEFRRLYASLAQGNAIGYAALRWEVTLAEAREVLKVQWEERAFLAALQGVKLENPFRKSFSLR